MAAIEGAVAGLADWLFPPAWNRSVRFFLTGMITGALGWLLVVFSLSFFYAGHG